MSSVSIVFGMAARIQYLVQSSLESKNYSREKWLDDAENLQSGLESLSNYLLEKGHLERKRVEGFVDLEKQMVELSYDIDDAIAAYDLQGCKLIAAPSSPKLKGRIFSSMKALVSSNTENTTGTDRNTKLITDLQSLRSRLEKLIESFKSILLVQPPANMVVVSKEKENSAAAAAEIVELQTSAEKDVPRMENKVNDALLNEKLSVVCIWGETGMGKTTLAKKAFYHPQIRSGDNRRFKCFAWVKMGHDFQTRNVLQTILMQLLQHSNHEKRGSTSDNIMNMDQIELTQQIFTFQTDNECLIVLENIVSREDWQSIRMAFPGSTNASSSKSKILITTPDLKVAKEAATSADGVYEMRPLTESECFQILKDKANFTAEELESVGKRISRLSGGLPLVIVVLGKSLKRVDKSTWVQLLQGFDLPSPSPNFLPSPSRTPTLRPSPSIGIGSSMSETRKLQLLGISYDLLPYQLKPLFLYMGQFPEGQEIQVEKLCLLLAAETLIIAPNLVQWKTLMDTVKASVRYLSDRRLVDVQEDKVSMTPGMYMSCQLHDQIQALCISKGMEEEFFKVVDFKSKMNINPSTCRIAIYLSKYEDGKSSNSSPFTSHHDTLKKIRSLMIFGVHRDHYHHESQNKSTWPSELSDLKEFIRLRILHFEQVNFAFRKFPKGIDKLVYLRYLSFRGCYLHEFPSSLSKLQLLETLDLRVTNKSKLIIPDVIFIDMKRLRYLYFPQLYESRDANNISSHLQLDVLELLEVLVNFDTGVCNIDHIFKLEKLQILSVISEGNAKILRTIINYLDQMEANSNPIQLSLDIRNFDCYTKSRVTVLKDLLQCKSLHSLQIEGQIGRLPNDIVISPNLTEMVFNGSELDDAEALVDMLSKVENLRSLILSDDAFVGKEITFWAESKFRNLISLKLLNLQYLEKLTFEKGSMPKLTSLVIDKCDYLKIISITEGLDTRLRLAHAKKGHDVYLVQRLPTIIE